MYDGDGATTRSSRRREPVSPPLTISARDGTFHRLWAITDPAALKAIRQALAPHQALIADGHHRYATYLQLRRRHRAVGDGQGPWDRGLAMLIDQSRCPLHLGAIHRSLAELNLADLTAPSGFTISDLEPAPTHPEPPG